MNKSIVVLAAVGLLLASFYPVEAQQPAKVRKIGFLNPTGGPSASIEAFHEGLRELGYIEGQNIVIEFRSGERGDRLTELATELVRQKVDVIVAVGPAANAAKRVTGTIPIVFTHSGDPIEAGFIDSLARPGRNMTGITWLAFELVGKRLEILKEAAPRVSRVAVLASSAHPGEQRELKETQSTARALETPLQYNQVSGTADVDAAFDTIVKENESDVTTLNSSSPQAATTCPGGPFGLRKAETQTLVSSRAASGTAFGLDLGSRSSHFRFNSALRSRFSTSFHSPQHAFKFVSPPALGVNRDQDAGLLLQPKGSERFQYTVLIHGSN